MQNVSSRDEISAIMCPLVEAIKRHSIQTESSCKDALLFAFLIQIKRQQMIKKLNAADKH